MREGQGQPVRSDLSGSQAARLLREGRLGGLLIERARGQTERHRLAVAAEAGAGDQADRLRRVVRALGVGKSRATADEGAAA
ncbi:MAG: hypothetical protein ACTS22_02915 [Phycisphaerales bacterium]